MTKPLDAILSEIHHHLHNGASRRKSAMHTPVAKRCYLAENPPSTDSNAPVSGLPKWVEGIIPTEEQVAPGRENFGVVLMEISSFDWLYLANAGHRRARFEFAGGEISSTWLVP